MRQFHITIFISAFLLFLVQPMMARFILPWFGGSASVWSACMLFFQAGLLAGYGYAYLITSKLTIKKQVWLHMIILVLSLIMLPVAPDEHLRPGPNDNPTISILKLLALSVGLPYIMLASTAPLLQYWWTIREKKKSPYKLYSLSNLASLVALVSFPVLIEPNALLSVQSWFWSVMYLVFVILCIFIALKIPSFPVETKIEKTSNVKGPIVSPWIWVMLSCFGVITFLSITNKLTQDFIVVPFLWVVPLIMYLLSFIITFQNVKWYNRKIFIPLSLLFIFLMLKIQISFVFFDIERPVLATILIYCVGVFLLCMVLHGEMVRLKPGNDRLAQFYFMLSAGGVLGGIFIALVVPTIFSGAWEIYIAFIGAVILTALAFLFEERKKKKPKVIRIIISSSVLVCALIITWVYDFKKFNSNVIAVERNFYGILSVTDDDSGAENWQRMLNHGDIVHGIQFMSKQYENVPTMYYGYQSGAGLALTEHPRRRSHASEGIHAGIIGLGIGTSSIYQQPGDIFTYYEINPIVEKLAREKFTCLKNSKGKTEVIIGDARIMMENNLKARPEDSLDVIIVDAFSGDYVPTHLLTKEAVEMYRNRLRSDGILAFNISNKHLNLMSVMLGLSESLNYPYYLILQNRDNAVLVDALWVIFTTNREFINNPKVKGSIINYNKTEKTIWTDDYSSVLPLLFLID